MDRRFRCVILDFDYTLADSSKGVIDCISYALDRLGFKAATAEVACQTPELPALLNHQNSSHHDH